MRAQKDAWLCSGSRSPCSTSLMSVVGDSLCRVNNVSHDPLKAAVFITGSTNRSGIPLANLPERPSVQLPTHFRQQCACPIAICFSGDQHVKWYCNLDYDSNSPSSIQKISACAYDVKASAVGEGFDEVKIRMSRERLEHQQLQCERRCV